MPIFKWSRTAGSNATADPTVNFAEGQAPSSLNDSCRAAMAAVAKYRDDIAGSIVTQGFSNAYVVTTNSGFGSLSDMAGQLVAFTPHVTSTATVTLAVDGQAAKPLRSSPGVELPSGVLVQGTPYTAVYNSTDGVFYLSGFFGNPYNVPVGGMMPYISGYLPNSSFVFPFGQAISRSVYSTLFSLISINYGAGDGSTTFNLPDLRGRAVFGLDNMGGSAAGRLSATVNGAAYGATCGEETHVLSGTEMPAHSHGVSGNTGGESNGHRHTSVASDLGYNPIYAPQSFNGASAGGQFNALLDTPQTALQNLVTGLPDTDHYHAINLTSTTAGNGIAHNNMPPAMVLPYILRII